MRLAAKWDRSSSSSSSELKHQSFAKLAGARLQLAHRASKPLKEQEGHPGNEGGGDHVEPELGVSFGQVGGGGAVQEDLTLIFLREVDGEGGDRDGQ